MSFGFASATTPGASMAADDAQRTAALQIIREQLNEAIKAPKCHKCGCLQQTVHALKETEPGTGELASILVQAQGVFVPTRYDCLGCSVCYPAIAANAFAEAYPVEGAGLDLCPTEEPEERQGWPPLPGDYQVLSYEAPIAVCALNTATLVEQLSSVAPPALAMVGTLHTENLGIERIIRNVLGNSHIRRLVVCGEDTQQSVGHLPGQSLLSLFTSGLDAQGRIVGARGKRPVLKNVSREQVSAFLRQVEVVPLIGETASATVSDAIARAASGAPGAFEEAPIDVRVPIVRAREPARLIQDPAGYCVVYPDSRRRSIRVEHFQNNGLLDCVIEGPTPAAVYAALIERKLVSRLDHAAYLGRELARAERSLTTGEAYVQDRAAGDIETVSSTCGCSDSRGETCRKS